MCIKTPISGARDFSSSCGRNYVVLLLTRFSSPAASSTPPRSRPEILNNWPSGQRRRRRLDGANDLCSQNRWWTSFTLLRIILSSIKARSTAPLTGNVTEHNVVLTTDQVEWRKNKQRWTECGRRRFHCAVDRARRLNNFREQWIFGHFKASVLPWIRKLSSGALIRTHNWLIIS